MREIVLDTETTGIDPASGDRIVEFGGIELLNHVPTGRTFHRYLNPERAMAAEAYAIHGLSDAFLADKPPFRHVADELADFVAGAKLVAHNAGFDIAFLNHEFGRTGHPRLLDEHVIDTLALARRRHPNASNSLDALCARYGIDTSRRVKHGALLDAELLAEVYIELLGGRQTSLGLVAVREIVRPAVFGTVMSLEVRAPRPAITLLTDAERAAHAAFVASLGPDAIWRDYVGESAAA